MSAPSFKLGVTLHSFTNEYCSFKWSFEDMMQRAALLGGGVEIVGPAHHRCFPNVSDEFERSFKSALERYALTPTCYGSYADSFMLPDRDLSEDELADYTILQLKGAAKLGFPVVRLQYFVAPVIERVLPWAERLNLKLGYELHVPLDVDSSATQRLITQIRHIDSPHLGLIPDAGLFARSIPKFRLAWARARGVSEALLQNAVRLWQQKTPLEAAQQALAKLGADERIFSTLELFWGSFGHTDPASLAQIMPFIIHVHGKFFSIDNGDEPDIRYEEFVHALLAGGYSRWMSSEYEGEDTDSFDIVDAHQTMVRHYIAGYLS